MPSPTEPASQAVRDSRAPDSRPGTGVATVVHVTGQLDYGGLEKLLVEVARHTDHRRYRLHFVSLTSRGPVGAELEALGCPVFSLDLAPGVQPSAVARLWRLFRRARADVVHTHNTRALLYAAPAARLARARRLIHTRHGQAFGATPRDRCLARLGARLADRVVCVSKDGCRLAAAGGLPGSRLRTIWNGIDPTRFRPADPAAAGPAVAVGRLSPEKDYATLIRAAARLAKQRPDFRLRVAGGGACEADLRALVSALGVGGAVDLRGPVGDVPEFMAAGSVFVQSSRTEGLSLTVLEAMAAGLPVVATRVGGNAEVVVEGETGLLVPPGDPEALAASVLGLWRDPARRAKMGAAGRERVARHFHIRGMVARYERLYAGADVPPDPEVPC